MTLGDREGLIARIRQVRRPATGHNPPENRLDDPNGRQPQGLDALEARVTQLEQQLEGLQDSVHREAERYSSLIAELQAQVQPEAMGAALAKASRDRGL